MRLLGLSLRGEIIIMKRQDEKIMFVKMDDGKVEGVFATDGYIDGRNHTPEEIARFIKERILLLSKKVGDK